MNVYSSRADELDGKLANPRGPSQVYQVVHVYGACPRVLSGNTALNTNAEPANPASPHWKIVLDQYGNVIRRDDLSATSESQWKNDATERAAKKHNHNETIPRVSESNEDTGATKTQEKNQENKQVKGGNSSIQQSSQTQTKIPPPGGEKARNPETGEIYPVTEGGKEIVPSPEINPPPLGRINPYTERYIRYTPKGSFIDPSTGDIYAPIATGYVNLRTGEFIQK
jgi:hypothetical protein